MTDKIDIDDLLTRLSANEVFDQFSKAKLLGKLSEDQAIKLMMARSSEAQIAEVPLTSKITTFNAAKAIVASENLASAIDTYLSDGNAKIDEDGTELLKRVRDAANGLKWTYSVKYNFKKLSGVDRTKPLISAPLYTSKKYPWPHSDDGKPLEPICQLNLAEAGAVAQISLGSGLLQLWMGDTEGMLREIPDHDVQLDQLTDVPNEIATFVWKSPMADRFYGTTESWTHGYVITGVRRRILTIPSNLMFLVEDRPRDFSYKLLDKAFLSLEKMQENGGMSPPSPGDVSYFGNFSAIQYDETERPDALLLMESGEIFTWGDCGNAQIFYRADQSGKVEFSFDWSCP